MVTCAICIIFGELGEKSRQRGGGSFFDSYPIVRYNISAGISVLPLSVVFVGMIALNNLCLKYVEVSFYNVARSLSIVFNVLFTFLILGEKTSMLTCSTLAIVLYGFYIGIEGEVNFSLFGTVAGVASSIFVSLNSIFTAKVLPKVQNDKSLLLYYNNVNALVLFIPLIVAFEYQVVLTYHQL
jgi:GDP-fucose transporter C1